MITSIHQAWQRAFSGDAVAFEEASEPESGLTRSSFLRIAATGALSAGLALAAGSALAGKRAHPVPVTDLDKFYDAWQDRFNAADLQGLADLYVSDVVYVNSDRKTLIGEAAFKDDLAQLFALKPQIVLGDRQHVTYKDTALTTNHWKITYKDADGTTKYITGGGIEVVRRQADGGWRFIIDDASRSAV